MKGLWTRPHSVRISAPENSMSERPADLGLLALPILQRFFAPGLLLGTLRINAMAL
jgi:hypothetical protein